MENNDNSRNNQNIDPNFNNINFSSNGRLFSLNQNFARNRSNIYRNAFFNQIRNIILSDMNSNGNNFYPLNQNLSGQSIGTSTPNTFMNILQNSLYQDNPYKKVTSSDGLAQIKKINFKKSQHDTHICPITQEEFTENQEISQLPCQHIFETDALKMWLKEESNKCPVCRYELDFKEINKNKITAPDNSSQVRDVNTSDGEEDTMPELEDDNIDDNADNIIDGLNRIISSIQFVNQPSRIIQRQNSYSYDRDLQMALLSSLSDVNEEEKNMDEVIEDHPDTLHDDNYDAMSDYDSSDEMFQVD